MESRKVLVLSTGHLTEATAKMLDQTTAPEWPALGGPYGVYGWFFYAHEHLDDGSPEDLAFVLSWAAGHGFHNVLFDQDADQIEELPFFDW